MNNLDLILVDTVPVISADAVPLLDRFPGGWRIAFILPKNGFEFGKCNEYYAWDQEDFAEQGAWGK